ncbi:MAG: PAS domain-containing protein, partial [Chloroflexi bacterium]|nr:PAS domain-containing protein [Chloroflexota bacterium]
MTQAQADAVVTPLHFSTRLKDWLVWDRGEFSFRNRHFWIILALVVLLALLHSSVEIGALFHFTRPLVIIPNSVPTSLFLVPVIYAALVFGLKGALIIALLATVSAIPNWIFFHYGWGRFACMLQLAIVNVVAFFVGQRVELERRALRQSKAAATALEISRSEYAHLLESSPTAVLVIGLSGMIMKANRAARLLFSRENSNMEGVHISALVGMAGAQKLLSTAQGGGGTDPLALKLKDGRALSIEPTLTEAGNEQGNFIIQAVFRDVTEEYGRQANLKAYAVSVIRALEEERQMIARELHDETIQELALLSRRLASIEDSKLLPLTMSDDIREARRITDETVKGIRDFTRR